MSGESVALHRRFGIKLPRYNQIVNALTWMSHSQALKRMSRDYVIDLYLRPPVRCCRVLLHLSVNEPFCSCAFKLCWQRKLSLLSRFHLGHAAGLALPADGLPPHGAHRARQQQVQGLKGSTLESADWLLQALAEQAAVMPALTQL